jgi:hypothetical protein
MSWYTANQIAEQLIYGERLYYNTWCKAHLIISTVNVNFRYRNANRNFKQDFYFILVTHWSQVVKLEWTKKKKKKKMMKTRQCDCHVSCAKRVFWPKSGTRNQEVIKASRWNLQLYFWLNMCASLQYLNLTLVFHSYQCCNESRTRLQFSATRLEYEKYSTARPQMTGLVDFCRKLLESTYVQLVQDKFIKTIVVE